MKRKPLSEDSILRKILASCRASPSSGGVSPSIALGIGDDAALFRPKPGYETILTCDWFLEGTHFLRDKHPPDSVGWKCLARAVSDVAAMGGTPKCFLLSLALPASLTGRWLDDFLVGLRRASRKFQCALAGGDTTRRDEVLINVTVIGEVQAGSAVRRSGARAGDVICVSGRLGEAELGLQILKRSKRLASRDDPLTRKHLYPEPRITLGRWLAKNRLASSMMDLSDGLSSDLRHLCAASGVGARLEIAKIPRVRIPQQTDSTRLALHGGDDYELLFSLPPHKLHLVPASFRGVPLTSIGIITRKRELVILEESGSKRQLVASGWDPFRERSPRLAARSPENSSI
jgi:thiamine-monophosphate kinase